MRKLLLICSIHAITLGAFPQNSKHSQPVLQKGIFTGRLVMTPKGGYAPSGAALHEITEKLSYSDWHGNTLTAEPTFVSDGASIPRVFWSITGGPWDGPYVRAAVIHDVGCDTHKYTWQVTHRMFYEAMMDSETPHWLALAMYWAVLYKGPKWQLLATQTARSREALNAKLTEVQADSIMLPYTLLADQSIRIATNIEAETAGDGHIFTARVYSIKESASLSEEELDVEVAAIKSREDSDKPMTASEIEDQAEKLLAPKIKMWKADGPTHLPEAIEKKHVPPA